MYNACKFNSDGTGAYLTNRRNNGFTTWGKTESFSWIITECEYSGYYEGTITMSGSMRGNFEFLMSGDLKQLYFDGEWLDKPSV